MNKGPENQTRRDKKLLYVFTYISLYHLLMIIMYYLTGVLGQGYTPNHGSLHIFQESSEIIRNSTMRLWNRLILFHLEFRPNDTHTGHKKIEVWVLIKIPFPKSARIRVYMGLRFLLLSSASPCPNTCSICKRNIISAREAHSVAPGWRGMCFWKHLAKRAK